MSPLTSDSGPVRLDAAVIERVRTMLARQPFVFVIPPMLRAQFAAYRRRAIPRYVRNGAPPLVILTLAIVAAYTSAFDALAASDVRLWRVGCSIIVTCVVVGSIAVQFARVQDYYEVVGGAMATVVLTKLVVVQLLFEDATAAAAEGRFCIVATVIAALALKLGFRAVLPMGALTIACSVACIALIGGTQRSWTTAAHSFALPFVVAVFIAFLHEQREAETFLQSVLLGHESQERAELAQVLERLANQDPLSGLPNRRAFDARLDAEWRRLRREARPLAILYADIDHFKKFNDAYGHAAGDECIARVARAIESALARPADLAARYGGEEFVVLLPETDLKGGLAVAARLLARVDALEIPHERPTSARFVSVSIGVASVEPTDLLGTDDVMGFADAALYEAKRSGRRCVRAYDDGRARAPRDSNALSVTS